MRRGRAAQPLRRVRHEGMAGADPRQPLRHIAPALAEEQRELRAQASLRLDRQEEPAARDPGLPARPGAALVGELAALDALVSLAGLRTDDPAAPGPRRAARPRPALVLIARIGGHGSPPVRERPDQASISHPRVYRCEVGSALPTLNRAIPFAFAAIG